MGHYGNYELNKMPTWCFSFHGNCKHNKKITQQVTYRLFPTASSNFWLEEGEKNVLLERLKSVHLSSSFSFFKTLICCCWFLLNSRQAGHRVGEHLERIMPMIVRYSKVENDDELREYCIQVSFQSYFPMTLTLKCAIKTEATNKWK